jgi:hypothetical protein
MHHDAIVDLIRAAVGKVVARCGRDLRIRTANPIGSRETWPVCRRELHSHAAVRGIGDEAHRILPERKGAAAFSVEDFE